jgi:hypothetical protein
MTLPRSRTTGFRRASRSSSYASLALCCGRHSSLYGRRSDSEPVHDASAATTGRSRRRAVSKVSGSIGILSRKHDRPTLLGIDLLILRSGSVVADNGDEAGHWAECSEDPVICQSDTAVAPSPRDVSPLEPSTRGEGAIRKSGSTPCTTTEPEAGQ